jgi:hypothetical protein
LFVDEADEFGFAKAFQLKTFGNDRFTELDAPVQALGLRFRPERQLSIRAERVSLRESVAPKRIADIERDRFHV